MSSIYHNLRTDKQYKAATGLSIADFDALYERFSQLYIPKTGNPYSKKTLPLLTDKREALFFILHYYKSYPTLQNLALYFGFSEFSASHYLDLLKPILKKSLERHTCAKKAIFTTQAAFDQAFAGLEEVFIDVTEVGVERPQNEQVQQAKYSGKKKRIRLNG
jgi:hypothetical protein